MKVLGIVVARAGSKGLKNKNLRKICGYPLVHYSFQALKESKLVNKRICSTDSKKVISIARSYGIEVPFIRPSTLADDKSQITDVIAHAICNVKEKFTHILLLQPTSPTVSGADIDDAITKIRGTSFDTLITGFKENNPHPDYYFSFSDSEKINWLVESRSSSNRQDFKQFFVRSGLMYLFRTSNLDLYNSIYGQNITALIFDKEKSISIDYYEDLLDARRYFKNLIRH